MEKSDQVFKKFDLFYSKYNCRICRKKLRYKADEIVHLKLKHAKKDKTNKIRCPECNRKHRTYHKLTKHLMEAHLNERPYKCKICSKQFGMFMSLKRHCRRFHPLSKFNQIVDYTNSRLEDTTSSRVVRFHDRLRFNEVIYEEKAESKLCLVVSSGRYYSSPETRCCLVCHLEFGCLAEMLCHVWLKHMRANRLVCWLCSVEYFNQADLVSHLNDRHLNSEIKIKCSKCDRSFQSLESSKSHMEQSHQKSKYSFQCATCDCIFNSENILIKHLQQTKNDERHSAVKEEEAKENEEEEKANTTRHPAIVECRECLIRLTPEALKMHKLQHVYLAKNPTPTAKTNKSNSYLVDSLLNTNTNSSRENLANSKSVNVNRSPLNRIDYIASKLQQKQQKKQLEDEHQNIELGQQQQQIPNAGGFQLSQQALAHLFVSQYLANSSWNNIINAKFEPTVNNLNRSLFPPFQLNSDALKAIYESSIRKILLLSSNNNSQSSQHHEPLNSNNFLMNLTKTNDHHAASFNGHLQPPNHQIPFAYPYQSFGSTVNPNGKTHSTATTTTVSDSIATTTNAALKCEYCGYMFKCRTQLDYHKISHASSNPKRPFKCHLCLVTFAKTEQLMRHMIVHQASELDSVCQICFSSFSRKQDLDRHMLFHSK